MHLTVNGKPRETDGVSTLLAYLQQIGVDPRIVAVERNGDIVKRDRFEQTVLGDGDKLEIVRMVGGG